jgi:hypothetical protein
VEGFLSSTFPWYVVSGCGIKSRAASFPFNPAVCAFDLFHVPFDIMSKVLTAFVSQTKSTAGSHLADFLDYPGLHARSELYSFGSQSHSSTSKLGPFVRF